MKEVYTLEDLASRELLDTGADKPARLAVIGHPVAHSASPMLHQAALNAAGIDVRYVRIDIGPGQVGEAFQQMRALGFIGCNVTVPHKLAAMEWCEVDPAAAQLGAVNTICFGETSTRGYNTDGPGFESAIHDSFKLSLNMRNIAIVGAGGGAGKAIATQCCLSGAGKLLLVNRTREKLLPLMDQLKTLKSGMEIIGITFDDPSLAGHCLSCDLIVNTSSVGLKPGDPSILPLACVRKDHLVYDTIYQPPVTPLLAAANALGCRTSNGLSMLIHQGALAFQRWYPGSEPLPVMRAAMAHLIVG